MNSVKVIQGKLKYSRKIHSSKMPQNITYLINYINFLKFSHIKNLYSNIWQTRKHSSRMRTVHLLTGEGGGGAVWRVVVSSGKWCCPMGWSCPEGGGGAVQGSAVHNRKWHHNTPWTKWLTDRCKNITLPQTSFADGSYPSGSVVIANNVTTNISLQKFVSFLPRWALQGTWV